MSEGSKGLGVAMATSRQTVLPNVPIFNRNVSAKEA